LLVNANFQKSEDAALAAKIGKVFEEGFFKLKRPDGFIQKTSFAPSSIGPKYNGSCSRRWVLAFQGHDWEETTEGINVAIMGAGTDAHAVLQKILVDAGAAVEIERELKLEYPPIRGFADAIMEVDGQQYVGEFKTTRTEAFEYYQFSGKPNASHVLQVMIYMHITGLPGFVMYQNSNTKELLVLPVKLDENLLNYTLDWLKKVYDAYKADQLPTRDLYNRWGKPGPVCKNCPVRKACADLPDGDITIGKFEIN
jgi:CRISPR/Cas system-associated exonuclease Cas4 (RecB family)